MHSEFQALTLQRLAIHLYTVAKLQNQRHDSKLQHLCLHKGRHSILPDTQSCWQVCLEAQQSSLSMSYLHLQNSTLCCHLRIQKVLPKRDFRLLDQLQCT